jgi:hypothetical protein
LAQTVQRTLSPKTPLLLHHAAITWTSQRTPHQTFLLFLYAWLLWQLPNHCHCSHSYYLAVAAVQLTISWPLATVGIYVTI